jgi:LPS O-antigen subunit length determinant protein (WzzB/FepE family)
MMKSKEFYEESISRLQKMIKHGVYVLLFDAFAVAVQIPFILAGKWVAAHLILSIAVSFAAGYNFNTLVDSKRQLDMYKADMELYYTKNSSSHYSK